MQKTLDRLREDKDYYGKFGKQFLSNSDIYALLNNPKQFRSGSDNKTLPMLHGSYLHTAILEPHKLEDFKIIDASTRSTKIYKEEASGELTLLKKEVESLNEMIKTVKSVFYDDIYAEGNEFEVPGITDLFGYKWKGKADIIAGDRIIDIKTTRDIQKFRWSAKNYNYDSQAYIYGKIFGLPMEFYVVDKSTLQLGVFKCSEEFIESGEAKVMKAIEVYDRFFKDGAKEDISKFFTEEIL